MFTNKGSLKRRNLAFFGSLIRIRRLLVTLGKKKVWTWPAGTGERHWEQRCKNGSPFSLSGVVSNLPSSLAWRRAEGILSNQDDWTARCHICSFVV